MPTTHMRGAFRHSYRVSSDSSCATRSTKDPLILGAKKHEAQRAAAKDTFGLRVCPPALTT